MLAIATGLLRAENGCLYLDAGGQRAVVIWPPATRLRGGDVLDASGRVVARIDDLVTLAGGWYGETKYGDLAAMLGVPVPPQCRTAQFFGASAVGPGAADAISSYPVIEGGTSFDDARCVGPVQAYGAGQPDWGEMYVMGDGVYANFTGRAASHVADLRRLVAADCAVFVRIVPLSSVEGRALQERITADDTALRAAGVRLTFVGFDPVSDRVQVGAYPLTDAVRSELERRYGAANLFIIEREAASGT